MATLWFRVLRHLLPDSIAWRVFDTFEEWEIGEEHEVGEEDLLIGGLIGEGKTLSRFVRGLSGPPEDAIAFLDGVHGDVFPDTTREYVEWEKQFGLLPAASPAASRANLTAEWAAQGGQSPSYLQTIVQAAGFPLYLHEWWVPPGGSPWTARDPRTYTNQPLIGTVQCGEAVAQCGEPNALCNAFLANETGYIVNGDLRPFPPPPVPDDSSEWPFFLYWGGATFGDRVTIDAARRYELERLVLKLCPAHCWLVMLVDYDESAGVFDDAFDFTFN